MVYPKHMYVPLRKLRRSSFEEETSSATDHTCTCPDGNYTARVLTLMTIEDTADAYDKMQW
eukprot:2425978-Amphidinium_carterae.2